MINTRHTIWTERYRPDNIDNYLGNEDFIIKLKEWILKNDIPHLLLSGPAGTGKTTAAKLVVKNINCDFLYINASDENGIETIREKVKQFASSASFKPLKVIILDEADFLTINAQAALRNIIETFSLTTRFILTCNYIDRINDKLQSRTTPFILDTPAPIEIAKRLQEILDQENVEYELNDLVDIVKKTYPDIRRAINTIQSGTINGKLTLKTISDSHYTKHILDEVKSKKKTSFNTIRQIIADNNVTFFDQLYKELHNSFSTPEATIIIEEYLFHSSTIPDREICFMSAIGRLLQLK